MTELTWAHTEEVNWGPRSDTSCWGVPYLEIHCSTRAVAQSEEVVELNGTTSNHLDVLSMMVSMWEKPLEMGRGPTRSMWMVENLLPGTGMKWKGVFEFLDTLDTWHGVHCRHHSVTSLFMPGQTYLGESSFWVPRAPG